MKCLELVQNRSIRNVVLQMATFFQKAARQRRPTKSGVKMRQ
jgi:hypothetical protein